MLERPEFVVKLDKLVSPTGAIGRPTGCYGLAEIQLPADTDLDSVRRKVAYDLYYIQHAGLWFDLRINFPHGLLRGRDQGSLAVPAPG